MKKLTIIPVLLGLLMLSACGDSTATSAQAVESAVAKVEQVEKSAVSKVEQVASAKGVDKQVIKPAIGEMKKKGVSTPAQPATTTSSPAVSKTFREGVHYSKIERKVNTGAPADKIAVQEMFWYGCPHCASLEPTTAKWKSTMSGDVDFQYIPAALNPAWAIHAKAFYAGEQLGLTEATHENLFKAIHEQGRRVNSEDALVRFFSGAGVNPEDFRAAMNNEETKKKVNLSASLAKRYGLTGVPSLIVDGQYRVLLYDGLRGYGELYEVVDFLLEKVRTDRSAS